MEARLAGLPLLVQPVIPALLMLIFVSNFVSIPRPLGLPHFVLSYVCLMVHEAGHFYMSWSGDFMHTFGGTLFELGVPLTLAIWFYAKRHFRCSALFIAWLSVGFFDVSIYSGDAVEMVLPLLGGNREAHDWNNMLRMLGWLDHTQVISDMFWSCGVVSGLLSILLYGAQILKRWRVHSLKSQKLS